MSLELRLLRSLLAVAEERHLHRAAERLNLSQPALSRQIQTLEARVGAPLLVRLPRGVELTEAGRVLAADARRLVTESDRALDRTRRAARGEVGHLSIGFIASAADRVMAPLLRALADRFPGVTFSLTERAWPQQAEGLETGADDIAFIRDLPETSRWSMRQLIEEPVCLVLRVDHPLAGRESVVASDLRRVAGEPFLSVREWMAPREARWGVEFHVHEELTSPVAVFALVRAGFGNAVMPLSYESLALADVRFVPIADETSVQQLAWSPDAERPAVRSLLDLADALYPDPDEAPAPT